MPRDELAADRVRLRHMLDAAHEALRFAAGTQRTDLDANPMLARALMHCLMEIGEAAARVTDGGRQLAPRLPWGQIVQTRHILVHVYWGVDLDKLWQTVREDLPALVAELEPVLQRAAPPADAPPASDDQPPTPAA